MGKHKQNGKVAKPPYLKNQKIGKILEEKRTSTNYTQLQTIKVEDNDSGN